jgi:hypothetical protein
MAGTKKSSQEWGMGADGTMGRRSPLCYLNVSVGNADGEFDYLGCAQLGSVVPGLGAQRSANGFKGFDPGIGEVGFTATS